MEFYVVVLIFISCMIVLALLIYYCQERRNPEYNVNKKQCDIASIALSIGAPELVHNIQNGKSSMYSQNLAPADFSRFYNQYVERQIQVRNSNYYNNYSTAKEKYSAQFVEDLSDSDTSNSEKIYFPPKTTAYSVARRMSASNNPRRISTPAVVCHLVAENKKLNGSSDCKIIINKESPTDDVLLDETSKILNKSADLQHLNQDAVRSHEVNKERELGETEKLSDGKKEDCSINEKLLKVPSFNPNYKIKRKNNSSSSLNVVEEEKEHL